MDTWSKLRDVATRGADSLFHNAQNVQTRTLSLVQSHLHDFAGDTFDFDVHLQRGDTIAATGNFKVHVAQVIFVTQNVRQNNKAFAFFDQTHCDTRNSGFDRHACIHQGQRCTTNGSHRR